MSNWGLDDDLAEDDDALAPVAVYQAEATGRTATEVASPPVEFERYREESTDAGDDEAAPLDGFGGRAREDDTEDEELFVAADSGPWTPESGFNDATNLVRVWVDEDQIINKVRINPAWREKLKDVAGLQVAFGQVITQIRNIFRESEAGPNLESDDREAREPLSWDSMAKIFARQQELNERFVQLGPEADGHWEGQAAVGASRKGTVKIRLDLEGALAGIELDPKFVEQSRVKEISDAVIQAHQNARAQYVPATYRPGERDQIMNELQDNRLELLAMMRRGFK